MQEELSSLIKNVRIPTYDQLPNVGLYLEQTTKYINQTLAPFECAEITGAMIRNYVKMGLIKNPVQKAYYADQIAHLITISLLKLVLPLEGIRQLFKLQEEVYADEVAYNYFCLELMNIVSFRFGLTDSIKDIGETHTVEKEMLRSAIVAISHIIYLNVCFRLVTDNKNSEQTETEQKN